jgi:hypothetical protein
MTSHWQPAKHLRTHQLEAASAQTQPPGRSQLLMKLLKSAELQSRLGKRTVMGLESELELPPC